jgi:hypothetical protein
MDSEKVITSRMQTNEATTSYAPFMYLRNEERILPSSGRLTEVQYLRYIANINTMYRRYDRRMEIVLRSTEIDFYYDTELDEYCSKRGYQLIVVLGGWRVQLSPEEQAMLQQLSLDTSEYPDHNIIIDTQRDIRYRSTILPQQWIELVVPLILSPTQLLDNGYLYDSDTVDHVYIPLLDRLLGLYKRGTIVLDSERDKKFIEQWELSMPLSVPVLVMKSRNRIYNPRWWNTFVTTDPTLFLQTQFEENNLNGYQEAMAIAHKKYAHVYIGRDESEQGEYKDNILNNTATVTY